MIARCVVVLTLVSACTDFPTYKDEVCGNFVLDRNEDCDDRSTSCVGCRLTCELSVALDTGETGQACSVPNYVCGADGFCHAGSGEFADTGVVPFRGRNLMISQVDGDGIGDVVGIADNALSVNYGDGLGSLTRASSILTPQGRGQPAFARLDAGDSVDLLLPTADGIAGYSSPGDALTAHSFAFDLRADPACPSIYDPFHVFAIDDRRLAVLTVVGGKVGIAVIPAETKSVCPDQPVEPMCGINIENPKMQPPTIDVYTTAPPARVGKVIAIRTPGPSGGLCVVSAHKVNPLNPLETYQFTDITPLAPLAGAPILADLDEVGDPTNDSGCPSLILSAGGPGNLKEFAADRGPTGACTLANVATNLPSLAQVAPSDVRAIGHLPLQPAKAGFGKDALVLASGVFAFDQARLSYETLYQSDRRLTYVQSGDLDRDGDLDGVAVAATLFNGVEDIDVLSRTSTGTFLLRRIDTADPISNFTVGDYDGDEVADIAYTERLSIGERLMLVFGTRDLPLPPVELGSFGQIVGLCPIQVPDSIDLRNTVQDLVVLDIGGEFSMTAEPSVTLLHGSPQRTLQSFIDPRVNGNTRSRFGGVVAGNFYGSPSIDVLAIEIEASKSADLWPLRGTEIGDLATGTKVATDIADCERRLTAGATLPQFCGDSAHYVAWSLGDRDVVLGIDNAGASTVFDSDGSQGLAERQVVMIDPMAVAGAGPRPGQTYLKLKDVTPAAETVAASLRVRSMIPVNLEGDGTRFLAVSFGGSETDPDEVRLCEIDATGRPIACPTLTSRFPELATWTCVDIAAAPLAPRSRDQGLPHPGADLAVLCYRDEEDDYSTTTVFRAYHDPVSGLDRTSVLASFGGKTGRRILAGDVTGDALEDLVILELGVPTSALHVLRQCAVSDVSCRGGGVGAVEPSSIGVGGKR